MPGGRRDDAPRRKRRIVHSVDLSFRRMTTGDRPDIHRLLAARTPAPDEAAIAAALTLFDERPDYGFIWVAIAEDEPVACALISFGISTRAGAAVARIDETAASPAHEAAFSASLLAELRRIGYAHIEALANKEESAAFLASGFAWTGRALFTLPYSF